MHPPPTPQVWAQAAQPQAPPADTWAVPRWYLQAVSSTCGFVCAAGCTRAMPCLPYPWAAKALSSHFPCEPLGPRDPCDPCVQALCRLHQLKELSLQVPCAQHQQATRLLVDHPSLTSFALALVQVRQWASPSSRGCSQPLHHLVCSMRPFHMRFRPLPLSPVLLNVPLSNPVSTVAQ